jgi:hypothetical protein
MDGVALLASMELGFIGPPDSNKKAPMGLGACE